MYNENDLSKLSNVGRRLIIQGYLNTSVISLKKYPSLNYKHGRDEGREDIGLDVVNKVVQISTTALCLKQDSVGFIRIRSFPYILNNNVRYDVCCCASSYRPTKQHSQTYKFNSRK